MPTTIDVTALQKRIASTVDGTPNAPTAGATDWNLRLEYLNRAQTDWAQTYNWSELYQEYLTHTSTSTGSASISLPDNFREIASYPHIGGYSDYVRIRPEERSAYDLGDRYFYVVGDPSDGYTAVVNPGTAGGWLASGATIMFPLYVSPSTLASPADKSMCPNPEFLVKRAISYLWEEGEDPRSPQAKVESERELLKMLESQNTHSEADENSKVRTDLQMKHNFRPGRD